MSMNMHKHITKFYNFSRKFSQVGATGGTEISLGGALPPWNRPCIRTIIQIGLES